MQTLIIIRNEAGQRPGKLFTKYLNQAGKGSLYKMIHKKSIALNGKRYDGSERLEGGDQAELFLLDETMEESSIPDIRGYAGRTGDSGSAGPSIRETERAIREKDVEPQKHGSWNGRKYLDIIYKDRHILVVDELSGMLSQKAKNSDMSLNECVPSYLIDSGRPPISQLRTFRSSIYNRLDRNTSGLVAAGKSLAGLRVVNKVFKDRGTHKYCQCPVADETKGKQLIVDFLKENENANAVNTYSLEVEYNIPIMIECLPLSGNGMFILLQVILTTERGHQIRAHLTSIGRPIVGDYKYGGRSLNGIVKKEYAVRSQLLHSWKLVIPEVLPAPLEYLRGEKSTAGLPVIFSTIMEDEGIGLLPGSQGGYPGPGQG